MSSLLSRLFCLPIPPRPPTKGPQRPTISTPYNARIAPLSSYRRATRASTSRPHRQSHIHPLFRRAPSMFSRRSIETTTTSCASQNPPHRRSTLSFTCTGEAEAEYYIDPDSRAPVAVPLFTPRTSTATTTTTTTTTTSSSTASTSSLPFRYAISSQEPLSPSPHTSTYKVSSPYQVPSHYSQYSLPKQVCTLCELFPPQTGYNGLCAHCASSQKTARPVSAWTVSAYERDSFCAVGGRGGEESPTLPHERFFRVEGKGKGKGRKEEEVGSIDFRNSYYEKLGRVWVSVE